MTNITYNYGTNEVAEDIENTSEKYLTFYLDKQLFAIPGNLVKEIIQMQPITYMPRLPISVKGIINIRGKILPLLELRLCLKKDLLEYTERTCIIVVEIGEISVGFIVDEVNDVTDIYKSQIKPTPKTSADSNNIYLTGLGKLPSGTAMLLNCEKLLNESY